MVAAPSKLQRPSGDRVLPLLHAHGLSPSDFGPALTQFLGTSSRSVAGHDRWVRFIERKKKNTVANTASAREFAGWCWSLAVAGP